MREEIFIVITWPGCGAGGLSVDVSSHDVDILIDETANITLYLRLVAKELKFLNSKTIAPPPVLVEIIKVKPLSEGIFQQPLRVPP